MSFTRKLLVLSAKLKEAKALAEAAQKAKAQ